MLGLLAAAGAVPPTPVRHGDFAHYTFAQTWQPGFCSSGGGSLRNQPNDVLIGLHGLWASRPRLLVDRSISAPQSLLTPVICSRRLFSPGMESPPKRFPS